jgi:ATP-dependent Clp protease, protease subunit
VVNVRENPEPIEDARARRWCDNWLVGELNDRLVGELIDNVKQVLKRESAQRLRDVYLIGDIDKDSARATIERLRELANDNGKPIALYINSAGGNVTDGLAIHDAVRHIVHSGIQVTTVVQGMAYSMGSIVLQAASEGCRLAFPHSWIMIHEPAKWAGWQSTTAAAQHLERLKQMQDQIYRILSERSKKPLRQIIRDTKRTDFYLDARKAKEYGLIDDVLGEAARPIATEDAAATRADSSNGDGFIAPPEPPAPPTVEVPLHVNEKIEGRVDEWLIGRKR